MSYLLVQCPHCFATIKHQRNLLTHFQSNLGCPYQNLDDCFKENSIASSSPFPPPQQAPSLGDNPLSKSYINDNDIFGVELDPTSYYPSQAASLILQQDSNLTDNKKKDQEFLNEEENDILVLSEDLNAHVQVACKVDHDGLMMTTFIVCILSHAPTRIQFVAQGLNLPLQTVKTS